MTPRVSEAYRICREIARREAKNFYYSFVALPEAKRNAICAVYAFMRHADDLSDDESLPLAARREKMQAWLDAWHSAAAGAPGEDPVFLALTDAQQRFGITTELLDQLVQGTAMDLYREEGAAAFDTYATFEDLYRYCYYVASVVGLVCIRIFGYTDPRAEKLAEETGIAFQLTNILRDVREDVERGRIYLPQEDMAAAGVTAEELAALKDGRQLTAGQRALLQKEAARAQQYYRSGYALLPLISPDARPALGVLIGIYHRLLEQIEARQYDVFSERISVSTPLKLVILSRGLAGVLWNRLRGAGR
ncbi:MULTISPECIES: phytoene/squalene synthase family protein [Acidobacterium]|uniref:Phytoene desaturase n=1 Tax=Acidobacterium capsulatum (strain ATCC 51196 / DSM 11244 / BCRC 80197 / JCM 7670 / NBRC 15755 / NCIMB 13165 / 161) TaxID=240015 RepID=C1F2R4_ACIC5|nr:MULTISPECIES: phytoene/squalene synthase family protein [Acidobacterium]ACO32435.1 phytoene desaturase [Acidobacterium capsulatum ATCC 51196]HCT60057.1 phytoene/squalene synthase family protein [Acidobacterium sp.]